MPPELRDLVAAELALPVDPRAARVAEAIAARHAGAAIAVLFYGSCLREASLDGLMLDFYLIVSKYRAAYRTRWEAAANRLLPPNVYPFEADGLAAKYAVLSLADLRRLCGPETDNPSVWARFAQPARLAWARDADAAEAVVDAVAQAAPTLLSRVPQILPGTGRGTGEAGGGGAPQATDPPVAAPVHHAPHGPPPRPGEELELWRRAFALTYFAELRAERAARPGSIVDADPDRYRRFTAPALAIARGFPEGGDWARTRRRGKLLTLARLAKASATYAGGLDYLAWKINRHAGEGIAIRPWQRRFPVIGALSLLPRLFRRGAVR